MTGTGKMDWDFMRGPSGFFTLDAQWRFAYLDEQQPQALLGKKIWEQFPALAQSAFCQHARAVMSSRASHVFSDLSRTFEIYPTPDGLSVHWTHTPTDADRASHLQTLHETAHALRNLAARTQLIARSIDETLDKSAHQLNTASSLSFSRLSAGISTAADSGSPSLRSGGSSPQCIGSKEQQQSAANCGAGGVRLSGSSTTAGPGDDREGAGGGEVISPLDEYHRVQNLFEGATRAIEQLATRLNLALQVINEGFWDMDLPSGRVWRSASYARIFNLPQPPPETLDWWAEHIHPDDRARVLDCLNQTLRSTADQWSCDYRFLPTAPGSSSAASSCSPSPSSPDLGDDGETVGRNSTVLNGNDDVRPTAAGGVRCSASSCSPSLRSGGSSPQCIGSKEQQQSAANCGAGGVRFCHYVSDRAAITRDAAGIPIRVTGAILDLTDLRAKEESLRALETQRVEDAARVEIQRKLLEHREMERAQLARDLHDGPLQAISGLAFSLQMIRELSGEENIQEMLHISAREVHALAADLRAICNELRPPLLEHFGLVKSLQTLADDFAARYPIPRLTLTLPPDDADAPAPALPGPVEIAFYRIFQETLNNAARHAGAQTVSAALAITPTRAALTVRDDGAGLPTPIDWVTLARQGHLGLVGIKERAEAAGGALAIESHPGGGTKITVVVELNK